MKVQTFTLYPSSTKVLMIRYATSSAIPYGRNIDTTLSAPNRTLCAVLVLALALGGCAHTQDFVLSPRDKPLNLKLAEVSTVDPASVRSWAIPDSAKDTPDTQAKVHQIIDRAKMRAMQDMTENLSPLPALRVDPVPLVLPPVLETRPITGQGNALDPALLTQLQQSSPGADALLRFGITDYGQTPTAWKKGVIVFEVVSTLGIAALAYVRPATRAIAGIYLVDETIEESIEAYSGFWALNEVYRPVRVQAELIDLHNGHQIWSDTETGFSDGRWTRMIRTVTPEERSAQLKAALHDAITKIVANLERDSGSTPSVQP
ncbi:hypothetical protein [Ferrovum myxofaciens]|nr:hypothetical protein [Ferrovum myxofaciens]